MEKKCEVCNGELIEKGGEYVCRKCGHMQSMGRKQFTYPLSDEPVRYQKSY